MAMDYNQLAVNILEAIGGSQNVENVSHWHDTASFCHE